MMLAVGEHMLPGLAVSPGNERDPRWVRMTTGFAGGVGGTHEELCGALSGGIMVIGGLHGRDRVEEDDSRAMELATRYRERFLSELGETRCAPLRKRVYAPGGMGSCAVVVERAARILLDLLSE